MKRLRVRFLEVIWWLTFISSFLKLGEYWDAKWFPTVFSVI